MTAQTDLSAWAWSARDKARVRSGIPVGVAVGTRASLEIYSGCNVELEFRLGIHAEVSALAAMCAGNPFAKPRVILIAAERDFFGPCGGCLDWICQLGGDQCTVIHEDKPGHMNYRWRAWELMPRDPGSGPE